jgi:acetylornithine deacetylase/succinyl-diaminopimelate desuccinylase-like protein
MNRRSNDVTAQSAAILSWLRQRESEMAALLADLVAIPTDIPPGKNYRACVDFLESQLRQVGLDWYPGLLEIRFYAAQGMPAFTYGPGLLSVAHGPNEYVDLRRIVDTAAIYALTPIEMLTA